jgi:hypothetical protein
MSTPQLALQICNAGTWRNVLRFAIQQETNVRAAAADLAKAAGARRLRICEPATFPGGHLAYCEAPDYRWRES